MIDNLIGRGAMKGRSSPGYPRQIYGVDFSGAADAGKRIWIATGTIEGDSLRIEDCRRAETLPGSGRDRDRCLTALRDFIARQGACAVGLDFPFGLPASVIQQPNWEDFIRSFPARYASPQQFGAACAAAADGFEWKRVTDMESQTPFSPYNLRLYRQTYFGIRDVLHPLVRDGLACVLPMQRARTGKPWLLEICPASTLKQTNLYVPYKGRTKEHRLARRRILEAIEKTGGLSVPSGVRSALVDDSHGDALDSVIAACATCRAVRHPDRLAARSDNAYALEGYVYV